MPTFSPTASIIATALAIIITTLMQGCAPIYYPNTSTVPLFSDAGEAHGSASLTSDGYELMGAVSPVKHIGIVASYTAGTQSHTDRPTDDHFHRELGLCYYGPVGDRGDARYQVLAGYGNGAARSYGSMISFATDTSYSYLAQSRYDRAFLQGSFGVTYRSPLLKLWGEVGMSLRVARVRFNALRVGDATYDGTMRTFFEPSFFIREGHPIVSLEVQMGLAASSYREEPFDYRTIYLALGAHLRLNAPDPPADPPR
jgi:hypothetical protein